MVTYHVQITKIEPNPTFDQEKWDRYEERQHRGHFGYSEDRPDPRTIQTRTLAVEITEDEWATIKRALIETWK